MELQVGKLKLINQDRDHVLGLLEATALDKASPGRYGCFCEAHLFVRAHQDSAVLSALERAEFIFPDGISLILGAFLSGRKIISRHPGPTIMPELCDRGRKRKLRHYFYGGPEGVSGHLCEKLKELYPGIEIAGHESPPFRPLTDKEERALEDRVAASKADILWVGLGAPKQEIWMRDHVGSLDVPLMLGVGAAFEYITGDQKWAPQWIRTIGLEWLYRMLTGGPRLFKRYLKYVPLCVYYLVKER